MHQKLANNQENRHAFLINFSLSVKCLHLDVNIHIRNRTYAISFDRSKTELLSGQLKLKVVYDVHFTIKAVQVVWVRYTNVDFLSVHMVNRERSTNVLIESLFMCLINYYDLIIVYIFDDHIGNIMIVRVVSIVFSV